MKTKHLHMHVFVRIRGPRASEWIGTWRCDCGTETPFAKKHGMYSSRDNAKKTRSFYPDLDIPWEEWLQHKNDRKQAPTSWWAKLETK